MRNVVRGTKNYEAKKVIKEHKKYPHAHLSGTKLKGAYEKQGKENSRLNEEMIDSECKCFTGRISRLINCLVGFYEDIEIRVDDNEQKNMITKRIYEKYQDSEEIFIKELI